MASIVAVRIDIFRAKTETRVGTGRSRCGISAMEAIEEDQRVRTVGTSGGKRGNIPRGARRLDQGHHGRQEPDIDRHGHGRRQEFVVHVTSRMFRRDGRQWGVGYARGGDPDDFAATG